VAFSVVTKIKIESIWKISSIQSILYCPSKPETII
jgi:hypothetical protein